MTAPIDTPAYRLDERHIGAWCAACGTVHVHGGDFGMRASHCTAPRSLRYGSGIVLRDGGLAAAEALRPELTGLAEALASAGAVVRGAILVALRGVA